ncbi:HAD-IIIC family phosphatase [Vallitaleaceae bacterium 9-2]
MKSLNYPFDSQYLIKHKTKIRQELICENKTYTFIKVAVLAGSTVNHIVDFIELFLLDCGLKPEFYISGFNQYYEEVMFESQRLEQFKPDIVFIHTSSRNILSKPTIKDTKEHIEEKLDMEFERYTAMWTKLKEMFNCIIIQNNFERPMYQIMGNSDISNIHGESNFIYRLNGLMYKYSQDNGHFYIHDVDGLSARYGLERWQEPKYWYYYKYALNINAIPEFCYSLVSIIKSLYGKNKRGIILDADNTLWKGIVGEDGANNLKMSTDTGIGYSFYEWQHYLKKLSQYGIVLSVASKNNECDFFEGLANTSNALEAKDFECIYANWNRKDENIEKIAQELQLGKEHFLFVDDNPTERALVMHTDVTVIDGNKPEEFIKYINNGHYFEVTQLTKEDVVRKQSYKANADRQKQQRQHIHYHDFLRDLELTLNIQTFDGTNIDRIVQLLNKSNQFNLLTQRYTQQEFILHVQENNRRCYFGELKDRFGDYGLIVIIMVSVDKRILYVEDFVMSCRAIKKNVEFAIMDYIYQVAKEKGCKKIVGTYIPTARNALVKDIYKSMGFASKDLNSGPITWEIEVSKYKNMNQTVQTIVKGQ